MTLRIRFAANLLFFSLFAATSAFAVFDGYLVTSVDLSGQYAQTMISRGSAVYYNYWGNPASADLNGTHAIRGDDQSTPAAETTNSTNGQWAGTLSGIDGVDGICYRGTIDVTAPDASQGAGTSQICYVAPPPPPPPCCPLIDQSPTCPIILDLNGDGIHMTGLDNPVQFWIDLQDRIVTTAWTNPLTEEGFLWIDLNHDHEAQVTELFGARMRQPDGQYYPNGYEALEDYDRSKFGGDGDGEITKRDHVWEHLRLWIDRNHDAVSQRSEISTLDDYGVAALKIEYRHGYTHDEYGNEMYLVSSYVARVDGNNRGNRKGDTVERLMADIEMMYIPNP